MTTPLLERNVVRLSQISIGRAILSLAMPIVLSNTLVIGHQLANAFWLWKLGTTAVAAVSVTFPVICLLVAFGGGFAAAVSILVSRFAGAGNRVAVAHVSAQGLAIVLILSFLLSGIGYVAVRPLLQVMGVASDVLFNAITYMRLSIISIVPMFAFAMFQSILRGTGETKLPLYLMTGSVIINLILDPLFIFGWGPVPSNGVAGAGYATLIAEGLAASVALGILYGGYCSTSIRLRIYFPDLTFIQRIVALGLPISIEQSSSALGAMVITGFVAHFGTIAIAAYGIGLRVLMLILIPALGISTAAHTLVGQNIGAGNFTRARQTAIVSASYAFAVLAAAAVLVYAGATDIIKLFVPTAATAVISEGSRVLHAMAVAFAFFGVEMSFAGTFRGAGDTLVPMIFAMISIWLIQIPAAFVLSHFTSLREQGLWCSFPISAIGSALLAVARFRTGRWMLAIGA